MGIPAFAKGIAFVLATVIGVGTIAWCVIRVTTVITDHFFLIAIPLACIISLLLIKVVRTIRRDIADERSVHLNREQNGRT